MSSRFFSDQEIVEGLKAVVDSLKHVVLVHDNPGVMVPSTNVDHENLPILMKRRRRGLGQLDSFRYRRQIPAETGRSKGNRGGGEGDRVEGRLEGEGRITSKHLFVANRLLQQIRIGLAEQIVLHGRVNAVVRIGGDVESAELNSSRVRNRIGEDSIPVEEQALASQRNAGKHIAVGQKRISKEIGHLASPAFDLIA